ncbi:MAG: hypothetical protein M0C28_16280 [Candidatus Moduliflexus flocculans]|nr:hypothetical protein [Candidatus Moduliflexus flocculans]
MRKTAELTIHPDDAHARDVGEGDTVRVFNDAGTVTCHAAVSPVVRPGTVALPKGLWSRHTLNGSTVQCPDARHAVGHRRGGLFQRRARAGRAGRPRGRRRRRRPRQAEASPVETPARGAATLSIRHA